MGKHTASLDLSAISAQVRKATRYVRIPPKRKPSKAMKAYSQMLRATTKASDRKAFGKIAETTFYQDRYTIRPAGDEFEIWDAETHDVYGPYRTLDDAKTFVRGL